MDKVEYVDQVVREYYGPALEKHIDKYLHDLIKALVTVEVNKALEETLSGKLVLKKEIVYEVRRRE